MANKTQPTLASVDDFLAQIQDEQKRTSCKKLNDFFKVVSQAEPKLWGASIIGYGDYHYKYESGREGDFFLVGFAPRKAGISLYMYQNTTENEKLLGTLGKFKIGKSCINIKKLDDINLSVLKKISKNSIEQLQKIYPYESH